MAQAITKAPRGGCRKPDCSGPEITLWPLLWVSKPLQQPRQPARHIASPPKLRQKDEFQVGIRLSTSML